MLALGAGGALRTVPGTQGRPTSPGEEIVLARWVLVVHRVELTDRDDYGGEAPPKVRLQLRATFTGDRSTYGLGSGLVEVRAPAGPVGIDPSAQTRGDRSSGGFDPDVAQEITLLYVWPDAPRPAPVTLRVLIRDERQTVNYLLPSSWAATPDVERYVDLDLDDQRAAR